MSDRRTNEELSALATNLTEALDDPKRYEWEDCPWEHLGDAERDVRLLIADVAELARRLERAEAALRPFTEKWDLHAADYLAYLVEGEECRIIPALVVTEMIEDVKRARAALREDA
jgi:hypothetical protein